MPIGLTCTHAYWTCLHACLVDLSARMPIGLGLVCTHADWTCLHACQLDLCSSLPLSYMSLSSGPFYCCTHSGDILALFYYYLLAQKEVHYFRVKNKFIDAAADTNQQTAIMINTKMTHGGNSSTVQVQLTFDDFFEIKKASEPYQMIR